MCLRSAAACGRPLATPPATPLRPASTHLQVAQLLEDYSMVSFTPLDIGDEESIEACLMQVDTAIQYGEDQDVKTRELGDFPDNNDDGGGGGADDF